mmetsp:Transcript_7919/g.18182  ORF Transcript_7919/g.18182 Transcript_7919/m.18182 type:complete len:216 (+) Transcript_7919:321-968(+)
MRSTPFSVPPPSTPTFTVPSSLTPTTAPLNSLPLRTVIFTPWPTLAAASNRTSSGLTASVPAAVSIFTRPVRTSTTVPGTHTCRLLPPPPTFVSTSCPTSHTTRRASTFCSPPHATTASTSRRIASSPRSRPESSSVLLSTCIHSPPPSISPSSGSPKAGARYSSAEPPARTLTLVAAAKQMEWERKAASTRESEGRVSWLTAPLAKSFTGKLAT